MEEPAGEYEFPEGLPAFEDEKRFRLSTPASIRPLALLESAATPGLRFVCILVEWLVPGYQLELNDAERVLLAGEDGVCCYALITFPNQGAPTANLRSPVVLNPGTRRGIQSIQSESRYGLFVPLRDEAPAEGPSC